MRIEEEIKLDFKDVLIKPKRSTLNSRSEVDLTRSFKFKYSKYTLDCIPIIASNMSKIGTFEMTKVLTDHNLLTCIHKHYSIEKWKEFLDSIENANYFIPSIGTQDDDVKKLSDIINYYENRTEDDIKYICIDIANGYSEHLIKFIEKIREIYSDKIIIAGNVVTSEMTEALILAGADVVKVGIGSGSVCETRMVTGVGYPQLSAIIECADAAHGLGGHIISDGGCQTSGDISRAFAAGADFVMIGGMLAGHKECYDNKLNKATTKLAFYGMSSEEAMKNDYNKEEILVAPEGKKVWVDIKPDLNKTIQNILGGLKSACTYAGARRIKDLPKCTTFIRVNRQSNDLFK